MNKQSDDDLSAAALLRAVSDIEVWRAEPQMQYILLDKGKQLMATEGCVLPGCKDCSLRVLQYCTLPPLSLQPSVINRHYPFAPLPDSALHSDSKAQATGFRAQGLRLRPGRLSDLSVRDLLKGSSSEGFRFIHTVL